MDFAKVDGFVARGDRPEIRCVFLALACLWGTFAAEAVRSAPPVFPGCPPSFNCPAPFPADPASTARLILFPGTSSSVLDNEPGVDLDLSCGVLREHRAHDASYTSDHGLAVPVFVWIR